MNGFIEINGNICPAPDRGLNFLVVTTVDAARNANNEFVGQKVGRDQFKVENLTWFSLPAETWSRLLMEFDNFVVTATIPNMVTNQRMTLEMYCGNRSAEPRDIDPVTMMPTRYTNCKVNIIDCGRAL